MNAHGLLHTRAPSPCVCPGCRSRLLTRKAHGEKVETRLEAADEMDASKHSVASSDDMDSCAAPGLRRPAPLCSL